MSKSKASPARGTAAAKKPQPEAVQIAREVKKRLSALGVRQEPPRGVETAEWNRIRRRLTDEVVREVADEWRQRRQGMAVPDFRPLDPDEVAEPVDLPVWRVRGLWMLGSHGVWAGPKKSLKTTLHDIMAVGVASDSAVMGKWETVEPGPVLIYAGEGSVEWRKKSLQRIAHDLYNVKIGTGDDQAQVFVVPIAYPFNTSEFRLALRKNIKTIRPAFVTLDSTYNYHPRGVNTADMYDRGPLFAELSALVRDTDPETSLLLIDHMRQAASLDLDAIAMAGVGQWADSWILNVPDQVNPEEGLFDIRMLIGSRRWGDRLRTASVDLGRFDEDAEGWDGPITVDIADLDRASLGKKSGKSADKLDAEIMQIVRDHPWELTHSQVIKALGGNAPRGRDRLNDLISQRTLAVEKRQRSEGDSGRSVRREVVGIPDDQSLPFTPPAPPRSRKKAGRGSSTATGKKGRG